MSDRVWLRPASPSLGWLPALRSLLAALRWRAYGAAPGFGDFADGAPQAACFVAGTRIETRNGPMPIEALRPGDQVRAVLRGAQGAGWAPVVWMGKRRVVCSRYARPEDVWPVRIAAGAFGPGRPSRDLFLSPEHAILDGASLIPIRYLINDSTIVQVPTEQVTYWHVELPAHDVLLAEGLEAESYLDTGNRSSFDGEGGKASQVATTDADHVMRAWRERGCARLTLEPALHAPLRRKLHDRALALGYRETDDAALLLSVGGAELAGSWDGIAASAVVPAGTTAVRVRSRSGVPCRRDGGSPDVRRLGVAIAGLRVDGRDVRLDDMRLNLGWHQPEQGWRWTTGDAIIPLTRSNQSRRIEVLTTPMLSYWQPPAATEMAWSAA